MHADVTNAALQRRAVDGALSEELFEELGTDHERRPLLCGTERSEIPNSAVRRLANMLR